MTNPSCSSSSIRAIIFDCDGTLVDSEEFHHAAWRQAFNDRGLDFTHEHAVLYTGKPSREIVNLIAAQIGCLETAHAILADKRSRYRELYPKGLPSIEGTVNFVKRLAQDKKGLNLKLGVASATTKSEIISHLTHLGIQQAFDVILSGQEDLKAYADPEGVNKPKPYIYLHAAKLLNVLPSECVVIEDSQTGIASGKTAGCFTIAIPNQFTKAQDLSLAHLKLTILSGISIATFFQLISSHNQTIRIAKASEIDWINQRYDEVEFVHSVFEKEIIAIAEIGAQQAGIGRLVNVTEHDFELGGMYVFEPFRSKGVAERSLNFYSAKSILATRSTASPSGI